MEKIKELLGEELFKQVEEKLKGNKLLLDDGKQWIPYHRFEEVVTKNKSLQEQIEKYEKDLKKLMSEVKENEELTAKLKELQAENEKVKTEYLQKETLLRKKTLLNEALLNEGVVDADARDLLSKKFDLDKLEIENDKIKGFDELVKPLKQNKILLGLFSPKSFAGKAPQKSNNDAQTEYLTKEQVRAMTEEDVYKNYDLVIKSMEHWGEK